MTQVDSRGAICKLLKIIALGVFRVAITLEIAKQLLHSNLRVTLRRLFGSLRPVDVVLKVGVTNS